MPVQALCALARSKGAYSFIDNAHGWGMIPVDCHGYGADFIAGAGHKWLCGGPGTGVFYVRNQGGSLPPWNGGRWSGFGNLFVVPGSRFVGPSFDPATPSRSWSPSGANGLGETNTPALYAMSDAAAFFGQVGLQNIYNRGTTLAQYLQSKIIARWGLGSLALQNLFESEFRTFLTAVNPFVGKDDTASYVTLRDAINAMLPQLAGGDPKIYIRSITWRDSAASTGDDRVAFRISTHAMYNNYDEVDELFNRLVELVDASGLPQLSG
jgi:selenocysteine lyase/cysteine desulfurase